MYKTCTCILHRYQQLYYIITHSHKNTDCVIGLCPIELNDKNKNKEKLRTIKYNRK